MVLQNKFKDTEVFLHIEQEILANKAKIVKAWKHHVFMKQNKPKQNKTFSKYCLKFIFGIEERVKK